MGREEKGRDGKGWEGKGCATSKSGMPRVFPPKIGVNIGRIERVIF